MAATPIEQDFPPVPGPFVSTESGQIQEPWRFLLIALWKRTGGSGGVIDLQAALDGLSDTEGAILVRGPLVWQGLAPASDFRLLRMGATMPSWEFIDGQSFAAVAANRVLSGPASGADATPSFRALVADDMAYKPATIGLSLTATGTVQGDAFLLASLWNRLTTVAAGTGVIVTNATIGLDMVVVNAGANTLNVYPPVGGQINALAVNAPYVLAVNTMVVVRRFSSTVFRVA